MMPMELLEAPLHSLDQDDQNEIKHDFFNHVKPMVPALTLQDATGTDVGVMWHHW